MESKRIVTTVALVGVLLAGYLAEAKLASGSRMMTAKDYVCERPDGRTERTMTWALKKCMAENQKAPEFLKDRESFLKWQAEKLKEYRLLLELPEEPEFKVLNVEKRDGYELRKCECYPYAGLAIGVWILVPEKAVQGSCPVVACMPGGGGSLEGLAGEPDPYYTRYPLRNKQAWWYVKAGMIAIAVENPGNARSSFDDELYGSTLDRLRTLLPPTGASIGRIALRAIFGSLEYLREHEPAADMRKIAMSGLSRGTQIVLAALASDRVGAYVHNDFVSDGVASGTSVTELKSGQTRFDGNSWMFLCAFAPRPLLLNEGGAEKGAIEHIRRAYELLGHPENFQVHYYDKYARPENRHDDKDLRKMTGLTPDQYLEYSNCDAYDHSFHAESAVPWVCGLFFGKADFPMAAEGALAEARAERERSARELYPPDGFGKGRKAAAAIAHKPGPADAVSERPDGRTGKLVTWALQNQQRAKIVRSRELAPKFRILERRVRKGYRANLFEFYPDDLLAVKGFVLVPDGAKMPGTPVKVCFGSNGASIEALAGEPDPYETPGSSHAALEAVKRGCVAVALALPGEANGSFADVDSSASAKRTRTLLEKTSLSYDRLVSLEREMCMAFFSGEGFENHEK